MWKLHQASIIAFFCFRMQAAVMFSLKALCPVQALWSSCTYSCNQSFTFHSTPAPGFYFITSFHSTFWDCLLLCTIGTGQQNSSALFRKAMITGRGHLITHASIQYWYSHVQKNVYCCLMPACTAPAEHQAKAVNVMSVSCIHTYCGVVAFHENHQIFNWGPSFCAFGV